MTGDELIKIEKTIERRKIEKAKREILAKEEELFEKHSPKRARRRLLKLIKKTQDVLLIKKPKKKLSLFD